MVRCRLLAENWPTAGKAIVLLAGFLRKHSPLETAGTQQGEWIP